ncbi:uncharacterized protein LODBEIA_P38460 [Lodderomyces beijingensis]|uniref:TPR-like protein n=1 Tax=Lodderomyces beijingensis TaxID=1775926 RepID=A0ABP0ZQL7_9ASCO
MASLQEQLAQQILLVPPQKYIPGYNERFTRLNRGLLEGKYHDLLEASDLKEIFSLPQLQTILSQYPERELIEVLESFTDTLVDLSAKFIGEDHWFSLQCFAIAFLQLFIQVNFTGPSVSFKAGTIWFPHANQDKLQSDCIRNLSVGGQQAYDLMQDPLHLIMAELIFEKLINTPVEVSLFSKSLSLERLLSFIGESSQQVQDPSTAAIFWWKSRALQIHSAVLSEPSSIISSVCGMLMNGQVLASLVPRDGDADGDAVAVLEKLLRFQFLLEQARVHIQSQTEQASVKPLIEAYKLSGFQLLLSGAKAKRTKFQNFYTSNLIVLAKSSQQTIYDGGEHSQTENYELDSDLLLEKPEYESLADLDMEIENQSKRIKLDYSQLEHDLKEEDRLLPIAMTQDDIPQELRELDPNNQPLLNNLDVLQLLLRFTVIKQTSPMSDPLVDEELMALVSRVLYSDSGDTNWLLFARALWERSLLESGKSRTVERGILQMTSLIEEIGLKIKSRVLPEQNIGDPASEAASRLRFIHQLPLLPQWSMDAKLAEQYMSLGVIKSALEIYERLELHCEAALCYAATDAEQKAEQILVNRIKSVPTDARAVSILGDIKQDPALWEKAWEMSHYAKAKSSLSHYYYAPPTNSGLSKNIELAISHMFDALTANPLSYENWFFYGCCGLESGQYELASEAFTRCVSLDDTNSYAWSNLASALLKLGKSKPSFHALKKAIRCGGDKKSWRIYENYMNVAVQLGEWNDVLFAFRELLDIKNDQGDQAIDLPVLEKLAEILVSTDYPAEDAGARLSHYQKSSIDLICNVLPRFITSSARCWEIVARVELWRKRPWAALECHEKAYRVVLHNPELESKQEAWDDAVEACGNLVSAFESLGEQAGKHGAGDVVCKDWKYKAKMTVRSLMSKGKHYWEGTPSWDRLIELKEDLS